jgi:disulfide bond formation protein DsbB|tara:strand:- start:591 stop:1076 length:486 start_codon:yes stop_codon:yes gene_type:complete
MPNINNKKILIYILFFSIFSLLFALFVEFFLGHKPCNLCLIQRIPYLASIIFIILTFVFKKYEKIFLIILSITFLFSTIISFYHYGVEQGFFNESLVCDIEKNINNISTTDLLKELEKKTISCKLVTFRVFGLSLATINAVISLILSAITFKLFINYEKNK